MKTLLKQIWFRRKSAAWLFIELAVLSVMAYLMSDQIIRLYTAFYPRGYEVDERIRMMYVVQKDVDGDSDTYIKDVLGSFETFSEYPGVKEALLLDDFSVPASMSNYNSEIYPDMYGEKSDNEQKTTVRHPVRFLQTVSAADYGKFLSLFGIEVIEGSLDNVPEDAIVITGDLAGRIFPDGKAIGRRVSDSQNTYTVCAVISPLKSSGQYEFYKPCAIIPGSADPEKRIGVISCFAFVPEAGSNPDEIMEDFSREVLQPAGLDIYATMDYGDVVRTTDSFSTFFPDEKLWTFFLMFVLVFLGTVSYFWMNDRSCMDENGIRMSYGATRKVLAGRYMLQAFVLVTAAFLTAMLVALNMELLSDGIFYSSPFGGSIPDGYPFLENRWVALAMVSAAIYAGLLLTVLSGTLLCCLRLRGKTSVEMMEK